MKVNFDGLRKNGAHAFNSLVRNLNACTNGDSVEIDADQIRNQLDDLRACLGTLLALEDDDGMVALEIDLLEFDPEEDV